MKKIVIAALLLLNTDLIGQNNSSYVVLTSGDTILCDKAPTIGSKKVVCRVNGEKKKFTADQVRMCYEYLPPKNNEKNTINSKRHIYAKGTYQGTVLIENELFMLCEWQDPEVYLKGTYYFVVNKSFQFMEEMERGKNAAYVLEKYFYCDETVKDLAVFRKASQKLIWASDDFYNFIDKYLEKCYKS
ncbi:MAG: hypothetical protein JNK73_14660 [Bacteroidia bacterium]|nr:hypothetical protein [Bacteroidia bacterium]